MAHRYGERWKIITGPSIGSGGQGRVFRVIDERGEYPGEYALKRVPNPKRRDRFINEVDAVKRLSHLNIVRLIDHSALVSAPKDNDKQYLVMPIAAGGDLGRRERYSLYTGALDAVLIVAKQLASALAAAHAAGVIHRDVKPENILFTGNGHEVWLADFGICLIRETDRVTPPDEVVGPRVFIAPELEDGGNLEVTSAVDVYSLGKVIFFMLSGGRCVPRERLDEAQFSTVFVGGERHRLLQLLLRRMICALPARIKTMDEVSRELAKIDAWEQNARLLPISAAGLAGLDKLREQAFTRQAITIDNLSAREQEMATRDAVIATFKSWLEGELRTLGAAVASDTLPVTVRDASPPAGDQLVVQTDHNGALFSLVGVELMIREPHYAFPRNHLLQFYLCEMRRMTVTVGRDTVPRPERDLSMAVLPFYRQTNDRDHPRMSSMMGYLASQKTLTGSMEQADVQAMRQRGRGVSFQRRERVTQSFNMGLSHVLEFKASEWPANSDLVHSSISEAMDLFVGYIADGANTVGA